MNSNAFHRSDYLRLYDASHKSVLWLRFHWLSSANGFKKISEVRAILFPLASQPEMLPIGLGQTYSIDTFPTLKTDLLQVGESELGPNHSFGKIHSQNHTLTWDLSFSIEASLTKFNALPKILHKMGWIKSRLMLPSDRIQWNGTIQFNTEKVRSLPSSDRPTPQTSAQFGNGTRSRLSGTRYPSAWMWAQCQNFQDERGQKVDLSFEGFSMHPQLGPWMGPSLSSFFFSYQNQNYALNHFRDVLFVQSESSLRKWTFRTEQGDLSFHGQIQTEYKNCIGLTYEDTNGSLIYVTQSMLAHMSLSIYRQGKLELTVISQGTTSFETGSNQKNPYVNFILSEYP